MVYILSQAISSVCLNRAAYNAVLHKNSILSKNNKWYNIENHILKGME